MEAKPLVFRIPADLEARLENWRAKQRPVPSKSEAVRHLLDAALDAAGIKAPKPKA